MNIREYLEKRAATIKQLQTAYKKTVKPFAQKGTKGQNFMRRPMGDKTGGTITLSGEGMKGKSTPKLHRASNLMTGLHEGAERSSQQIHKGFMGHNDPTIGLHDYLRINTLKGYTPAEKKLLRESLTGKPGAYGVQRRTEARILGEKMPEHKATFDALVAGKTRKPDGTRLLNRHERKKINKAYRKLQEERMKPDTEAIGAEKSRYSKLDDRLANLSERMVSKGSTRAEKLRELKKMRKLADLWNRIKGRHQRKIKDLSGKPSTDFRELLINRINK